MRFRTTQLLLETKNHVVRGLAVIVINTMNESDLYFQKEKKNC